MLLFWLSRKDEEIIRGFITNRVECFDLTSIGRVGMTLEEARERRIFKCRDKSNKDETKGEL